MTSLAPKFTWDIQVETEEETREIARHIAASLKAEDFITLSGDLGAGKTAFARALIQTLSQDLGVEVPSPTFTLLQIYETPAFPILHADFYRLVEEAELEMLGWEDAGEGALVLVEWADRMGEALPAERLDIHLSFPSPENISARHIRLTGWGAAYAQKLAQIKAIYQMLCKENWEKAERHFMVGDASNRAYERLTLDANETRVLMVAPPRPDGPPLRGGKSYSALVHLAEDMRAFVALAQGLRAQGLSAPKMYAQNIKIGVALLEDLGRESILDPAGLPIVERYERALDVLVHLHTKSLPDHLPIGEGEETYHIPPYDLEALLIETELLLEWYVPHIVRKSIISSQHAILMGLWRKQLEYVCAGPQTWVLRDFHSPNLLFLPKREGVAQIGLLDFQDCVIGHPAYDVVSLLQDARVSIPDEIEEHLYGYYLSLRLEQDPQFDIYGFTKAYTLLGAQRAAKIVGIFARLDRRDHKPHYLSHLPRVTAYFQKCLAHEACSALRAWYETYVGEM